MTVDATAMELVRILLTWVLVVMGWMVVSDQQSSRELAKNYYGRLQALREGLKTIEAAAIELHTSDFDMANARKITRWISELGIESSHLRKTTTLSADVSYRVAQFRRAITIENFDHSSHRPQPSSSRLIENISVCKDLLDRALLDSFQTVTATQPSLARSIASSLKRIF